MKPFDSFDEFANPIFANKPAEVIEEPVVEPETTKTRGRKKKEVAEPVDIPADVPVVEE